MAKGNNNGKSRKTHGYSPYDASNSSFVKRITTRVTEILPQPSSWISRWLSPASQVDVRNDTEEDDEEEEQHQPVRKRLCLNTTNEFVRNHIGHLGPTGSESGDISPILSNRLDHDSPIPGPSGLNLNQRPHFVFSTPAATQTPSELIPKVNGDDGSDSSESTSGCSSLVPQGEKASSSASTYINVVPSKRPPLHSSRKLIPPSSPSIMNTSQRSVTTDRPSKFPKIDLNSSRGRPSFDSFVFNNPLNKSLNLNSSQNSIFDVSTSSPFYKGRTMYGGASSCKEALNTSLLSPRVGSPKVVSVQPIAAPESSRNRIGTSAMRILKALEQFSSPEPKKTPVKSGPERRKRKLVQPYEELVLPQVQDLLRIKRKERPKTQSKAATGSVINLSLDPSRSSPLPPPLHPYSLREDNLNDKPFVGCIRGNKIVILESEQIGKINLPDIKLPITTLPKFSMPSLPKDSVTSPLKRPPTTSLPTTIVPLSKSVTSIKYNFTEPIVESSNGHRIENIKQSYKFSEPLDGKSLKETCKTDMTRSSISDMLHKNKSPSPNTDSKNTNQFMISTSSTFKLKEKIKEKTEMESSFFVKPPTEYKSGNIMDCFKNNSFGDKFKIPEGNWSCEVCLVNNNADKDKCVACEAPKPSKKEKNSIDVKSDKKETDKNWNCKKCKLVNKESDVNCKTCGADKNGINLSSTPLAKGLQEYMKATTANTWECKECFVRNKTNVTVCVACSSLKPGTNQDGGQSVTSTAPSLNVLFKKAEGSWECITCLVSNKSDEDACVACGTSKPGTTKTQTKPTVTFQFGIPATSETEDSSFSFGIASNNKKEDTKPSSSGFSFGLPSTGTKTESNKSEFKFGIPLGKSSEPEPGFSFESTTTIKKEKLEKDETVKSSTPVISSGFTFAKIPNQSNSDQPTSERNEENKPKKRVSFGEPLVEEKTISSDSSKSSLFSFSSPTKSEAPEAQKFSFSAKNPIFTVSTDTSPSVNSTVATSANSLFKFGSSATVSSTTESTGGAQITVTTTGTGPETETAKTPLFTFSSANAGNPAAAKDSSFPSVDKKNNPSFGAFTSDSKTNVFANSSTSEMKVSFSFPTTESSKDTKTPFESNKSLFGPVKSENKEAVSNRMFSSKKLDSGKSLFASENKEPVSNMVFGAKRSNAEPFFGQPNEQSKEGGQNIFGSKPVNSLGGASQGQEKEGGFIFGAKTNDSELFPSSMSKDENKNALTADFGLKPPTSSTNFFNSTNDNKNIFGNKSNDWPPKIADGSNVFEPKPSTTSVTGFPSSTPIVGNNAESKPAFTFNAVPNQPSSTPFAFNKEPENKPVTGGFTFSSTTNQPPVQANAFSFFTDAPKLDSQPQQQQPTMFGAAPNVIFNAPPNPPAPAPAPFTFSASHPEPQNALFGFSAPPQVPTGNAGSPFTFGAQNSIPSQPTPAQPPTFDPNIKPNFKFTGGAIPSFSAAPSQAPPEEQEKRKIRKAVRRNVR